MEWYQFVVLFFCFSKCWLPLMDAFLKRIKYTTLQVLGFSHDLRKSQSGCLSHYVWKVFFFYRISLLAWSKLFFLLQISTPSPSGSSQTFKWVRRGRRWVYSFFFDISRVNGYDHYGMFNCLQYFCYRRLAKDARKGKGAWKGQGQGKR